MRHAVRAGFLTGGATAALALLIFIFYENLFLIWPFAYAPVSATGVVALARASSSVKGRADAALVGGAAGLAASLVSAAAFLALGIAQLNGIGPATSLAYWNLNPVLLNAPFLLPRDALFWDLPIPMPDWWPYMRTVQGNVVPQMLLTLTLFVPLGTALSATQSWAAYALGTGVALPDRLVSLLARVHATFASKLRMGFLLLTALIFLVGWLGFASTEEMHNRIHAARAIEHTLGHVASIQSNVAAEASAVARLGGAPDAAALQQAAAVGQRVTTELAHVMAIPPVRHGALGVGPQNLTAVHDANLELLTEINLAVRSLNDGAARALDLYRSGRTADAQAAAADVPRARDPLDRALRRMELDLKKELATSLNASDSETHLQQIVTMLLIFAVTAIAFPLGYVFSQVGVRPVSAVGAGLERLGRGEFAQRVEVENRDEFGELAARINETGQELERLYGELRGLNEGLQQKVQQAVREIERSRMLRRYLPHQVADTIIASNDDSILVTHRREITVLFGDLRGFTGFSETAEPEVVMRVLAEYHAVIGELIQRFQGTLEYFAGDGVMVYFNDPLPAPDHPARAVRMAVAMRERVGELAKGWRRLGFELNFGVGIAIGYATLGTVGFEGRHDYSAIGAVCNLASRLSDEAQGGQILVNQRVYALVEDMVEARPVGQLQLKGFLKPVATYDIVALQEPAIAAS